MDNRIYLLLGYLATIVCAVMALHLMSGGDLPPDFGDEVLRPFSTLEKFLGFGS